MTTFDEILPKTIEILNANKATIEKLDWLIVNRDLNGRVRLIIPEKTEIDNELYGEIKHLYSTLAEHIAPHSHTTESGILLESSQEVAWQGAARFALNIHDTDIHVVDRLATEANWTQIAPERKAGPPRVVFFSIKGGVGRSTALAATAWSLAQAGKRVLVLDLDLQSPGLSSSLLPVERQPKYGITDWLVEDLVENGDAIFDSMIATSNLSHDGEIFVVPAHGADSGEYISKLGRVWMPKVRADGSRERWSNRLQRLLTKLEAHFRPDIVLVDSRAGIDEVSSSCVTDLGANLILLFALEGSQTWNGYRILFRDWLQSNTATHIRERLKIVAALVPETDSINYMGGLREHAYELFTDSLYDEIAPPNPDTVGQDPFDQRKWRVAELVEGWNFDEADEGGPHYPWPVKWHRSFTSLRSLQGRMEVINTDEVRAIFGPLVEGVAGLVEAERNNE